MKTRNLVLIILIAIVSQAKAQNYTTLASGSWTTASNWNNTSGWGTATPPIDGSQGSGTITMAHNMSISTNYNVGSATLNIQAGKSLTVSGSMTLGGGSAVNVSGTLNITGDLTLNSTLNILPGGQVIVNGSVYVNSSNYLIVGTNASPPPYADLVVKTNLRSQSSGDVTVNKNGRVAVFGNVTDDGGGGTFLTVNNGGEMYVHGNVAFSGGGDSINNNNTTIPYGLYVNGTTTNSGGGSSTTINEGNKTTMQATNPTFYNWVATLSGSPLPISLIFFKVDHLNANGATLTWATASELNFDYFVLESSGNGTSFTELVRIQGHGTTNVRHDYSYNVIEPVTGKSYYRLRSVDFDGKTETFNVVAFDYAGEKSMSVYPIPVVDSKVNVDFNFVPAEEMKLSVTDLSGIEVFAQGIVEQQNSVNLPLNEGTYILYVRSGEFNKALRIVVK